MRNTYIYIFIFIFCFSCKDDNFIPNPVGNISGIILEESVQTPISGVLISTVPASETVLTDSLGQFELTNIPEGDFSLSAEKEGYLKEFEAINIVGGQTANVTFLLRLDDGNNMPPRTPEAIFPLDGAVEISTSITLSWSAFDSDERDTLKYNLYFFENENGTPELLLEGSKLTEFELQNLEFNEVHRWQVAVNDGFNNLIFSPIWSFKTMKLPEHRFLWVRKEGTCTHLFSSDENSDFLQLTEVGDCWRPRLNPQRNRIAFLGFDQLAIHLFSMNRDGSGKQKLTQIPLSGGLPNRLNYCWAKNGSQLFYPNENKLYRVNNDGSGTTQILELPSGNTIEACDWSDATGELLIRISGATPEAGAILLSDENGSISDTLFSNQKGQLGNPMFSPDGSKILFTHDVSGFDSPEGRQLDSRIFLLDLMTSDTIDLSFDKPLGMNDLDARFSPNGGQIIFMHTSNDGVSEKQIWRMDLDGFNRELLFENAEMPDWK